MFNFEFTYKKDEAIKYFIVFYIESYDCTETFLSYGIEKIYEKYHRPDAVIFVTRKCNSNTLKNALESINIKSNAQRFGANVTIANLFIQNKGDFEFDFPKFSRAEKSKIVAKIIDEGLKKLSKKNSVIEHSPPGTCFIKPSQDRHKIFISGYKAAQDYSEISFITMALLYKYPEACNASAIYIDTPAISYIAQSVTSHIKESNSAARVSFKSFDSYDGIEHHKPDSPLGVFVLISGTSSNNMMIEIKNKWNLEKKQIVNLFSFTKDEQVLCELDNVTEHLDGDEVCIRRTNNFFLSESVSTKEVILKKLHGLKLKSFPFENLYKKNSLKCHKRNYNKTLPLSICYDTEDDKLTEKIQKWIRKTIIFHAPPTILRIILDDEQDFLSSIFCIELRKVFPKFEISKFRDIQDIDFKDSDHAIIAFAPAISSGNVFASLNRNLRLANHSGMRIFVTPFFLYQGSVAKKSFLNSITYGPELTKYKFFNLFDLNVTSNRIKSSWELELDFLESNTTSLGEVFEARIKHLHMEEVGLQGLIGINTNDLLKPLSFSKQTAFWDFDYEPADVSPESVYFMVTSILQEARDNKSLSAEDSLDSGVHQLSVLSPENFIRYNDPLLQSCIWRSAKSSELDYTYDKEVSIRFISILERLLNNISNVNGEAFADILLGIAMKKIKVTNNELSAFTQIIDKETKSDPVRWATIIALNDYISNKVVK